MLRRKGTGLTWSQFHHCPLRLSDLNGHHSSEQRQPEEHTGDPDGPSVRLPTSWTRNNWIRLADESLPMHSIFHSTRRFLNYLVLRPRSCFSPLPLDEPSGMGSRKAHEIYKNVSALRLGLIMQEAFKPGNVQL